MRFVLHEFSLPYPRPRTLTPETAHSHTRDCALTRPRLRTRTHTLINHNFTHQKHRRITHQKHRRIIHQKHRCDIHQKTPVRHTSQAIKFWVDCLRNRTHSRTPHATTPCTYGHNEKTAPPHTRERGYQVLIESLVFMLPQQQVLLPQRQVLQLLPQQLQPLVPQPLELTCASGGYE